MKILELSYNLDHNPYQGLLGFPLLAYLLGIWFLYISTSYNSLITYVHILIVFILAHNIYSHNVLSILIIICMYIHLLICFEAHIRRVMTVHALKYNLLIVHIYLMSNMPTYLTSERTHITYNNTYLTYNHAYMTTYT